jgi:hypothetical protein
MSARKTRARAERTRARAEAARTAEETYAARRENDERDLDDLPWWRQRTLGNMLRSLIH